jgi:hypothetical protein
MINRQLTVTLYNSYLQVYLHLSYTDFIHTRFPKKGSAKIKHIQRHTITNLELQISQFLIMG